jgi:flagellar basal body P-ring formation protein FlgA
MRRRNALLLASVLTGLSLGCAGLDARADDKMLPVPSVAVPAGAAIRADMLVERGFAPNSPGLGALVESKDRLVGRVARRTLLPGQPIPANAVDEPGTVTRGVPVKLIVMDDGLTIVAYAAPLQSGGVGARIRLRNLDTGVIVMGIVQPDGTVRAGNG